MNNAASPLPIRPRSLSRAAVVILLSLLMAGVTATPPAHGQEDPFFGQRVISLAVHPDLPERVFAGTLAGSGQNGSVLRSQDSGRSWKEVTPGAAQNIHASFSALAIDPSDSDRIWLGEGVTGRLWSSDDGGDSWVERALTEQLSARSGIGALLVEPGLAGSIVWVGTRFDGVWRSDDGGQTWRNASDGLNSENALTIRALVATPDGRLLAGTHAGLFVRPAEGALWERATDDLPADAVVLTVALDPGAPDSVFFLGTSRYGVWRSNEGGQTWQPINQSPLRDDTFASALGTAVESSGRSVLLLGTDESGYRTGNGGRDWQAMESGDQPWTTGADAFASVGDSVFAGTQNSGVLISADAGNSWSLGSAPQPATATATTIPSDTPMPVPTNTPTLAPAPSPTAAEVITPTDTPEPASTPTAEPTAIQVVEETALATPESQPEDEDTLPSLPVAYCGGILALLLLAIAALGISVHRSSPKTTGKPGERLPDDGIPPDESEPRP
ncbi:MAG: hypothetical protein U9R25_11680 [Chloroflexota bacterium]|nr:hypothetical protein [Chloroflexota bacterium]